VVQSTGGPGIYCVSPTFQGADGGVIEPTLNYAGSWSGPQQAGLLNVFSSATPVCGSQSAAYQIDTYSNSASSDPTAPPNGGAFTIVMP
jgi:hypothetical protein